MDHHCWCLKSMNRWKWRLWSCPDSSFSATMSKMSQQLLHVMTVIQALEWIIVSGDYLTFHLAPSWVYEWVTVKKVNQSTNLRQFILQFIVFCHVEFLLVGRLIKVMQELPVFNIWVHIILRGRRKQWEEEKHKHICTHAWFCTTELQVWITLH